MHNLQSVKEKTQFQVKGKLNLRLLKIIQYALKKIFENNQTALQNFFKGVFMIFFSKYPSKKIFETSQTTLRNLFEGVFINYFQILHPQKTFEKTKWLQ